MNPYIDNELSNKLWSNPAITYSQKTTLSKLHTSQYMGNTRKQLFLVSKDSHRKHAQYVTPPMQTHGFMYS